MTQYSKPKITEKSVIAKSRLFQIEQVKLTFSNGVRRTYERMKGSSRGAVMIVPVHQGNLLLIREYAVGTEKYELGFPKGLIDTDEKPVFAANRELQEEIGFSANKITQMKTLSLAPGYFSSKMQVYLAEELTESWLEGDEPEPLELVPWPLHRWQELIAREDFSESRSICALFLAQKHLKL